MAGHLAGLQGGDGGDEGARVTISKHAETYGNGQWYTLELFEDTATGIRGIAESYGEIKHFPRAMRTKRNFDAAIEDEERAAEGGNNNTNNNEFGANNDREEALGLNAREANFAAANGRRSTARKSTGKRTSASAAKRKKSSSSSSSARRHQRSTAASSDATADPAGLRRSSRVNRASREEDEGRDRHHNGEGNEGEGEDEERRRDRERTPRPTPGPSSSDRVTRSSGARVAIKSETEDLEHLLDSFEIASNAESGAWVFRSPGRWYGELRWSLSSASDVLTLRFVTHDSLSQTPPWSTLELDPSSATSVASLPHLDCSEVLAVERDTNAPRGPSAHRNRVPTGEEVNSARSINLPDC